MILFFLPLAFAVQHLTCSHDDKNLRCVDFVRNYDGDTITFLVPNIHPLLGRDISVRVFGLDTPEIKTNDYCEGKAAKRARDFVKEKLTNAFRIDLQDVKRDKYFRILAKVNYDGRDLSEILLKEKLAYPYFGKTKQHVDWCRVMGEPPSKNPPKPRDPHEDAATEFYSEEPEL